jgi:hypothetical protein
MQQFLVRILNTGPDAIFKFRFGVRSGTARHLEPSDVNGKVLPKVNTKSFWV